VLLFIAFPSFTLLYSLEELVQYQITLKIIGHQWYWSYELSDPSLVLRYSENESDTTSSTFDLAFDSYILPVADFKQAGFRLLEVDNAVTLPHQTHIRLLITSVDVLHSWTIPSFGVKLDACPGRLNQTQMYVYRTGTFYGQCSELCGVNHSLMPITVKITKKEYNEKLTIKQTRECDECLERLYESNTFENAYVEAYNEADDELTWFI
jgi:cytochrome c oxidase subunit 2